MKRLTGILVLFVFFTIIFMPSCTKAQSKKMVRPSALSGSWYPADKAVLEKTVKSYLGKMSKNEPANFKPVALIAPHAGYAYSGKAAATAYNCIKGKDYKRVIILAPSHYTYFRGIALPTADAFETPLGTVDIDKEACDKLLGAKGFVRDSKAHSKEHSIEIQLPFLQTVLKDFRIVPLLVGEVEGKE